MGVVVVNPVAMFLIVVSSPLLALSLPGLINFVGVNKEHPVSLNRMTFKTGFRLFLVGITLLGLGLLVHLLAR